MINQILLIKNISKQERQANNMSNLVFIHSGKAWRVTVVGEEVTLTYGIVEITFKNTGELKEQIKEELEKAGK